MSSTTPNIGLVLPVGSERVSRQIINENNTKIDTAIGTLNSNVASLNNSIIDFNFSRNINDNTTSDPIQAIKNKINEIVTTKYASGIFGFKIRTATYEFGVLAYTNSINYCSFIIFGYANVASNGTIAILRRFGNNWYTTELG